MQPTALHVKFEVLLGGLVVQCLVSRRAPLSRRAGGNTVFMCRLLGAICQTAAVEVVTLLVKHLLNHLW